MTEWIKQHKWKTAFVVILATLWLAIQFFLQPITKQAILDYTQPYGIEKVDLKTLDFDLFGGIIRVYDLNLYQKDSENPIVQLGQLDINIQLWGLLQQRIYIESLSLAHSKLPFSLENQQLLLAGIPLTNDNANKEQQKPSTFLPGLDKIALKQIQLTLESKGKTTTLDIDELFIDHLFAWSKEYGRVFVKTRLNNTPIQASLKLYLFDQFPKIVGTIRTHGIHLTELEHLMPKLDFAFDGKIHSDTTFTLAHTKDGLKLFQQGNISIQQPRFSQTEQNIKAKDISWKGDIHYQQTAVPKIDLNGKLQALNLEVKQAALQAKLANIKLDGKTHLDLSASPNIDLQQNISLQGLQAQHLTHKQQLATNVNAKVSAKINTAQKTISLQSQFNVSDFSASQAPYQAEFKSLHSQANVNFNYGTMAFLAALKSIDLNKLVATNKTSGFAFAQQQALKIKDLQLNEKTQLQISGLSIQGLEIAKTKLSASTDGNRGLVKLNQLNVNQAQLKPSKSGQTLVIDQVNLNGSETHLTLNKNNSIDEIDQLLAALVTEPANTPHKTKAKTNKDAKSNKATDNTKNSGFHYQLNSFKISGNNPIHLVNNQLNPAMQKTIQLKELTISQLDSQKPTQKSPYQLTVLLDEFSKFASKGKITPLAPKHFIEAKTTIDGMSLVELSPFAESNVGYHIASGQLSAELDTKLSNNQINAKNELHLHKLKLESLNNEQAKSLQKNFPIPLETGLSLLQDKNDNIDLSLPIKGDINSPDFDINDVISIALGKAMAGATRTYLLMALQPFGAIAMATEYAINQSSAINLQPVSFKPGSSHLQADMQAYLQKIHKMTAERSGIQIKLCGGVSEADRFALKQQAIKQAIEKQAANNKATSSENKTTVTNNQIMVPDINISNEQLMQFAKQRQNAIKRYLVKRGSASKQLILCKPKISKDTQNSQVELNI